MEDTHILGTSEQASGTLTTWLPGLAHFFINHTVFTAQKSDMGKISLLFTPTESRLMRSVQTAGFASCRGD